MNPENNQYIMFCSFNKNLTFLDEDNKVLTDIPESFDDDTADRLI